MDVTEAGDAFWEFVASDIPRFPTGYSLDDTCGMIAQRELGLMLARSAVGKSTWMLNVIRASQDVPTVVFNMEMSARMQFEWLVAMTFCEDLNISADDLESVARNPRDPRHEALVTTRRAMHYRYPALNFEQFDESPTVDSLARLVDAIEQKRGIRPQRVFIDHLSLMKGCRDYEGLTRTGALLHTWAMEDDLAVIAIQQAGRTGGSDGGRNDGHVPTTISSGVYGGEDAADWIWGMYQPQKDPKFAKLSQRFGMEVKKYEALMLEYEEVRGVTRLQVVKNRMNGNTDLTGVKLRYDRRTRQLREERR